MIAAVDPKLVFYRIILLLDVLEKVWSKEVHADVWAAGCGFQPGQRQLAWESRNTITLFIHHSMMTERERFKNGLALLMRPFKFPQR